MTESNEPSPEDAPEGIPGGAVSLDVVFAELYDALAMAQAQNDVVLSLLIQLISRVEDDIEKDEVLQNANEQLKTHYQRRIGEMKENYTFFGGGGEGSQAE